MAPPKGGPIPNSGQRRVDERTAHHRTENPQRRAGAQQLEHHHGKERRGSLHARNADPRRSDAVSAVRRTRAQQHAEHIGSGRHREEPRMSDCAADRSCCREQQPVGGYREQLRAPEGRKRRPRRSRERLQRPHGKGRGCLHGREQQSHGPHEGHGQCCTRCLPSVVHHVPPSRGIMPDNAPPLSQFHPKVGMAEHPS